MILLVFNVGLESWRHYEVDSFEMVTDDGLHYRPVKRQQKIWRFTYRVAVPGRKPSQTVHGIACIADNEKTARSRILHFIHHGWWGEPANVDMRGVVR